MFEVTGNMLYCDYCGGRSNQYYQKYLCYTVKYSVTSTSLVFSHAEVKVCFISRMFFIQSDFTVSAL